MLAFLLLSLVTLGLAKVDYSGHQVLTLMPTSVEDIDFLTSLHSKFNYKLDFWSEVRMAGVPVMVRVPPTIVDAVKDTLTKHRIHYKIAYEDLQRTIMAEQVYSGPMSYSGLTSFDFGRYHDYEYIVEFLKDVTKRYPAISKLNVIGRTYENRPIYSVKIHSGKSNASLAIMIECGLHGREWTATSACLYMVDQFITNSGSHPDISSVVNKYEIHIVPQSNPDGYIYSRTEDRLWRKTRSHSTLDWLRVCRGADANRNFDVSHCGVGTSRYPCDEIYCGDRPFSESEARALRDMIHSLGKRLRMFFSIHAFSQFWMTPYGTTKALPLEYKEMERVAKRGAQELSKKYGTKFLVGSIANVIYEAAGSSVDYAYIKADVNYSYALELRDSGRYGFILPERLILPTCEETLDGVVGAILAAV